MRRAIAVVVVVASAVLFAAPSQAGAPSPFTGHWEGINEVPDDPNLGDDSRMIININAGPDGHFNVVFRDFGASSCGLDDQGEPLYAGQAIRRATVDGNDLLVYGQGGNGLGNGDLWCMARPPFVLSEGSQEPSLFVTYDPATDTLSDGFDVFFRVGA